MSALVRWLLWQLPGWVVVALVVFVAAHVLALPVWLALAVLALFVLKDVVLFPAMKTVLRPPASTRLVGARGRTTEALRPSGYVRANGELWRATTRDGRHLPAGAAVTVVGAEGLTLVVEERPPG
jgi:membrane-bound serine protease (ClpP class)